MHRLSKVIVSPAANGISPRLHTWFPGAWDHAAKETRLRSSGYVKDARVAVLARRPSSVVEDLARQLLGRAVVRGGLQGQRHHALHGGISDRGRRPRPRLIEQPFESLRDKPAPPLPHGLLRHAELPRDDRVGLPAAHPRIRRARATDAGTQAGTVSRRDGVGTRCPPPGQPEHHHATIHAVRQQEPSWRQDGHPARRSEDLRQRTGSQ